MDIVKTAVSIFKFLIILLTLLTFLGESFFERELGGIQIALITSNILLIISMMFISFKNHSTAYIIISIIGGLLAVLMYFNNLIVLFGAEILLVLYIFLLSASVYFSIKKNNEDM